MWIAKFRNWHKDCLIRPLCEKYKVTDYVYLLNSWGDRNKFYYTELHILDGEREYIEKFITGFKKNKSFREVESQDNWIFTLNVLTGRNAKDYSVVFDRRIIYIKPVVQRTDGYEDWEIASWDRDVLMKIMENSHFDMKLVFVRKLKKSDLFLPQIQPEISEKQKQAINLAIKNGYYNFPRKNDLNELSKVAKVSKQTFQENLRKAENKLIPFLAGK